jgi:hypothetical protein
MAMLRHGMGVLQQSAHECRTLQHLRLVLAPQYHPAWLQHAGAAVLNGGSVISVAKVAV